MCFAQVDGTEHLRTRVEAPGRPSRAAAEASLFSARARGSFLGALPQPSSREGAQVRSRLTAEDCARGQWRPRRAPLPRARGSARASVGWLWGGRARGEHMGWAAPAAPCGGACAAQHGVEGFCWCWLSPAARAAFAARAAELRPSEAPGRPLRETSQVTARPAPLSPEAARGAQQQQGLPATPSFARRAAGGTDAAAGASGAPPCVRLWCDESVPDSTEALGSSEAPVWTQDGEPASPAETESSVWGGQRAAATAPAVESRAAPLETPSPPQQLAAAARVPRRRRRRTKKPPWQTWRCSGCGRALPERHSGCPATAARLFDLDPAYGPADGLTRAERHARAKRLGLSPPELSAEALAAQVGMPSSPLFAARAS